LKLNCDKEGIEKSFQSVKDGGIIVFPTDTVYGIGCDPYNKNSVDRIYQIKERPKTKSFPILAYSMDAVSEIVEFDDDSKKIANKFWPGPLTLIVKLKDQKLKESLDITEKIAIRVPDNDCLLSLLEHAKFLIGTSANRSGEPSFTKAQDCYESLKEYDVFLDGGDIASGGESTILEINKGKAIIHRQGALKEEEITEFL
jgi:L-threonylcarbamoyladenylate synthase